ncbi:MAG: diguanylate cyclase [Firmicutes bacterium]|nr:diguanylate cyclase [Bacillota bacterium]
MFIQRLLKEKRTAQLYTLTIFIVLALLFLCISFLIQINDDINVRGNEEIMERGLIQLEKTTIAYKLNRRASDILFIADTLKLSGEMLGEYTLIEKPWIAYSNRYRIYDQIRYLDSSGQERVRINYSPQGAYAVPQSELQDKSDRSYFLNGRLLSNGKIYLSEMDLNVENGQIEIPFKPMLRLVTPMPEGNWQDGVIVLNYTADDLLEQVRDIAKTGLGEVYLLNKDGYWLYNNIDPAKEWGFLFESRMNESFANEFPQEWAIISGGARDGQFTTDKGVFFYTVLSAEEAILGSNFDALVLSDAGVFYILSFLPADTTAGQRFLRTPLQTVGLVLKKYWTVYLLLSGIAFVLAAFIAVGRAQNREILYFSEFDALTGVYNRRAGYQKLTELRRQTTDRGYEMAVCFIDINGLKEVNDMLGHDQGDELIKSVAAIIRDSVRGNDYIARIGGDEFLIVFDRLSEAGAESVWQRITHTFDDINSQEERPYAISISHGIGVFMSDEEISVDEIIARADAKMYEKKKQMKKSLTVIRNPKQNQAD